MQVTASIINLLLLLLFFLQGIRHMYTWYPHGWIYNGLHVGVFCPVCIFDGNLAEIRRPDGSAAFR